MQHKPHARVAGPSFRRIDEVDGVPTTHTQHGQAHGRMVTDGVAAAEPLPFAAKKSVPAAVAIPVMLAVITAAFGAALVSVTAGLPNRGELLAAAVVALLVACAVMAIPGLVRAGRRGPMSRSAR